ncbi:MAG: glutamate--cysteine ligase, partial [Sphingomonadales bacterium]|nr:glutamate--cysteine ligase [Sphingomonadales bacterium]
MVDETQIIESKDQLVAHIAGGSSPKDDWRIGTEHEKFGFHLADNSPLPYEGPNGIRAMLEGMHQKFGWNAVEEDGKIIGLADPESLGNVSLEPGGQF